MVLKLDSRETVSSAKMSLETLFKYEDLNHHSAGDREVAVEELVRAASFSNIGAAAMSAESLFAGAASTAAGMTLLKPSATTAKHMTVCAATTAAPALAAEPLPPPPPPPASSANSFFSCTTTAPSAATTTKTLMLSSSSSSSAFLSSKATTTTTTTVAAANLTQHAVMTVDHHATAAVVTASSSSSSCSAARPIPIVCSLQKKKHMLINPHAFHAAAAAAAVTDMKPARHLVTWLDAMKAQSPPHKFHSHELLNASDHHHQHITAQPQHTTYDMIQQQVQEAAAYTAWVKKHPSAVSMFKKLMVEAKAKQVVVFLDYDGTLSPIVDDPDRAHMSDDMRAIVKEVATYFPTAIISGRARPKVYEFVQLAELYYAGSHGMDIMGPADSINGFKAKQGTRVKDKMGNDVILFQPASEYLPLMDEVCKILSESSKSIRGARVEHNRFCVTIHFRRVKEESWAILAEKVENVLKDYPTLNLTHGRKVLEIRPAIAWDKGKAVDFLLSSLGLADSSDIFPVYIGDDRTDEDAFKVLKGLKHSCGILVTSVPKETKASFSLQDPHEVMEFLLYLVRWKKQELDGQNGSKTSPCF